MQYRIATVVILFATVLAWVPYVEALEFNAAVGLSTVRMRAINQQIQLYADDHHESIAGIHSAWSLSIGTTLHVSFLGVEPCLYGHGLFASSGSDGGPIQATALGLGVGGRYSIGPWNAWTDLGVYRGTFTFLRAGYNGASGWGFGVNGAIDYTLHLTQRISLAISLTLRWLAVGSMSDEFGTSYVDRAGAFFDMSGVGAEIDLIWIAW